MSIDINDIIKEIVNDVIREINRKYSRIAYGEQQVTKIIKRFIFYIIIKGLFKRYGMIIKDEPIIKEQKLVVNDLFISVYYTN